MSQAPSSVRVDKWLWAARMFKTRSAASTACSAGHVKISGESVKPSKAVKPLTIESSEAMAFIVSGGVSGNVSAGATPPELPDKAGESK